tara:strand:- start:651 stop:860 length:210 start_codon:yes stop_codon:yes gene_type:complete
MTTVQRSTRDDFLAALAVIDQAFPWRVMDAIEYGDPEDSRRVANALSTGDPEAVLIAMGMRRGRRSHGE